VLLVESNPNAARRFAGEWIHPEGARVMREHGLLDGLSRGVRTSGFVVFPNDGLGPIRLAYPDGAEGFACEHETLVTHLRRGVARMQGVDYVEGLRAQAVSAREVALGRRGGPPKRLHAERIVVAVGRSHRDPISLGEGDQVSISLMAGLLIEDAELPYEGFGHVFLEGPGPVLAYRIDETRIRLCIDVPHAIPRGADTAGWIWRSFADGLPASIRDSVRRSLSRASIAWAANAFRPRRYLNESGVALVGDAAGVFHPLTAMGITMSLLDAEALGNSPDLESYASERAARTYVPELLSNAIYQAFVRDDAGSRAIRESIFRSWRASAMQRSRTMKLLGATSTRRADFLRAFSQVALHAGAEAFLADRGAMVELIRWLRWPWASLHPRPDRVRSRSLAWASPEAWAHPGFFRSPHSAKEKRHAN
jgi:2-polyprenyl-6-methoxyphenol hydroxylase-like FAD-dependent oxidoreductase